MQRVRLRPNFFYAESAQERRSTAVSPATSLRAPRPLVEAYTRRVIWSSDCQHQCLEKVLLNDGKRLDGKPRIAPASRLQRKLLADDCLAFS